MVSVASAQERKGLIPLKAAIHISSSVSDGEYSLVQIAQAARDSGISVIAFTDRDHMRWEYGLWPLRNLIRKTVEDNSISTFGIQRYLKEIHELQNTFTDIILIPGVEAAPFYYWEGSPFKSILLLGRQLLYYKNGEYRDIRTEMTEKLRLGREHVSAAVESKRMRLYNWHVHMLGIGLNNYRDFNELPVIGNPGGVRGKFSILSLWPLIILVLGLWGCKVSFYRYTDQSGRHIGIYSKKRFILSTAAVLISIPFVLDNPTFSSLKFDQYHGDQKNLPYQNYIDYINEKGGLVFWAHPEVENTERIGDIDVITRKYIQRLLDTKDYAGFSILPEGSPEMIRVGGIWDNVLFDYCRGLRQKPVWAIGGLAFDRGDLVSSMKNWQTVILVSAKTRNAVLDALKKGKMYVVGGENSLDFCLDEFSISDQRGDARGDMGETVPIINAPVIHLKGGFLSSQREVEVSIIREGEIVQTYKTETPFSIEYSGDGLPKGKSYYRVRIQGKGLNVIANPIFVTCSRK